MSQVPQDVEEFIAENARDIDGIRHRGGDYLPVDDLRGWMTGHVRVPVELIENTLAAVREELNKAHNEAYPVCCGMAGPECCGSPEPEWPPHAMAIMDALGPIEKELSVMLNASKESV